MIPSHRQVMPPILLLMRSLPLVAASLLAVSAACADDLRVGIIGLDTSHVIAFTKLLNDANAPQHIAGAKVTEAVKTSSPDIPESANRVEKFAEQIQKELGVKLVGSIEELCRDVDCVLLESVDGRPHLEQARAVIAAKKRLFIDKPFAGSLHDVLEICRLAKEAGVPIFTSSAYRYYETITDLKKANIGPIRSAISYGPAHLEAHHPDLYWYAIHPSEGLYTAMGTGCESVTRTSTPETDVVVGAWSGGRVGVLIGLRTKPEPEKLTIFGTSGFAEQKPGKDDYTPLVREIVHFFQTGVSPVPPEETIELYTFMEAADESKRRGGAPVKLSEVLEKARHP